MKHPQNEEAGPANPHHHQQQVLGPRLPECICKLGKDCSCRQCLWCMPSTHQLSWHCDQATVHSAAALSTPGSLEEETGREQSRPLSRAPVEHTGIRV